MSELIKNTWAGQRIEIPESKKYQPGIARKKARELHASCYANKKAIIPPDNRYFPYNNGK